MKAAVFTAYCLVCLGGGRVLTQGGKRACEREATSHMAAYGHATTILPEKKRTGI